MILFLVEVKLYASDVKVIDGDTIVVNNEKIRFFGIDAPEMKQTCFKDGKNYFCGLSAKKALVKRIGKKIPKCISKGKDIYKRTLAECYIDGKSLISETANTVMTRTFSKVYALAALRIGWAYAPLHIIEVLNKIRGPFNLSTAAINAGAAAIEDHNHVAKSVELNSNEKVQLLKAYEEAQIHVHGGAANFLLLDLTNLAKKNSTMQQEMVVGLNNYLIKNIKFSLFL